MAKPEVKQTVRVIPPIHPAAEKIADSVSFENRANSQLEHTPIETSLELSDEALLDELQLSLDIPAGDLLYNDVMEHFSAAGRGISSAQPITDEIQFAWNSLTRDEREVFVKRIKHFAAVAQAVSATVDEYAMYTRNQ